MTSTTATIDTARLRPGADLTEAHIEGLRHLALDVDGANMQGAVVSDAVLDLLDATGLRASFSCWTGVILKSADLCGARMVGSILADVDLTDAFLAGVDLRDAVLVGVKMRYADLRGAFLRGALLVGCDLTGAILDGADVTGAVLEDCKIDPEALARAYRDG